jgi:hypothetical protein
LFVVLEVLDVVEVLVEPPPPGELISGVGWEFETVLPSLSLTVS